MDGDKNVWSEENKSLTVGCAQTLENGKDMPLRNGTARLRAEARKTKESKLVDKKNKTRSHLGENVLS